MKDLLTIEVIKIIVDVTQLPFSIFCVGIEPQGHL